MAPLVSIIIPAYNAGHYLPTALQSCLDQTYPHLEIIVVDDGSTDQTRAMVAQYPQVKYLYQPNSGVTAARNTGIQHSTGDFLQFLDADDRLLPTKIERCMAVFEQHPDTGLVYTDYETRSADLQTTLTVVGRPETMPEGQVLATLLSTPTTFFAPACPVVRREAVIAAGGFQPDLHAAEDWLLWVKLAAAGVIFRAVPEKLVWYRDTPGSASKSDLKMAYGRLAAVEALREMNLPPELDLEGKIAARHYLLALKLWEQGQVQAARKHLRSAIHLHPTGRLSRRVLLLLSYGFGYRQANQLLTQLQKWR